jgi:hypothetical protein
MRRAPDFVIGGAERPYLRRWTLFHAKHGKKLLQKLAYSLLPSVFLHEMRRDDDDRALHDHVANNISIVLRGGYIEYTEEHPEGLWRWPGSIIFRRATLLHRLELMVPGRPSWSIWIRGPRRREWGFQCGDRWVPWYKFVDANDPGQIGKGCEQ